MQFKVSKASSYLIVFILCVITLILYWSVYSFSTVGIDDANIYFTYAKNFSDGFGFVFFPGGERVEGFTSFAWMLIVIFAYNITGNFELLLLIINFLFFIVLISILFKYINFLVEEKSILNNSTVLFFAFLVLIPGFVDWNVISLMETGLWTLLITTISLIILESAQKNIGRNYSILFIILNILLLLARPESLLLGPVFLLLKTFNDYFRTKNISKAVILNLPIYLVFILAVLLLSIWRLDYFGYLFPNTYYAKVGSPNLNFTNGLHYLRQFFLYNNPLTLVSSLIIIISGFILIKKIFRSGINSLNSFDIIQINLTIISTIGVVIPLYTGGDHFGLSRFYQSYVPIMYLLFFNIKFYRTHFPKIYPGDLNSKYSIRVYMIIIIMMVIFLPRIRLFEYPKGVSPIKYQFELAEKGRELARNFNEFFQEEDYPSVGILPVGGFGYAYHGQTIDLLGLNNTKFAHSDREQYSGVINHDAFNKNIFFQILPDLISYELPGEFVKESNEVDLLENNPNYISSFSNRVLKGLFYETKFKELYTPCIILNKNNQKKLFTHANYNFINKLNQNIYKITLLY